MANLQGYCLSHFKGNTNSITNKYILKNIFTVTLLYNLFGLYLFIVTFVGATVTGNRNGYVTLRSLLRSCYGCCYGRVTVKTLNLSKWIT